MTIKLSLRWWVMPYVALLKTFCAVTMLTPSHEKLALLIVKHGIKTEVKK